MNYKIRQNVYDELEHIWLYSRENWGSEQANQYVRGLMSRFQWLAENPHAGRQRDDIKPGYHCYPQGAHLVFYQLLDDTVYILDIPHQSMDIDHHF